ncbi:hypothetical protein BL0278 [Bifidobacterium longum NCC2705]|uniref:Uncharacterized protein n=1 Tax=Bifidobacterium longum (strain NCC 2705) TaxID=206672 RepID=Q8G7I7_BIFLO|nr:hypothetical protein BL0278 [Bifidobacterium longum NCC2705]
MARRTRPLRTSLMESMDGECTGKRRSTPVPKLILRTTKVSRTPAPLRAITTPVKVWIRELLPSWIFTFTSTVSPGRKAGISSAGFMCLASKASTALTIVFLQCCRISATDLGPSTRLRIARVDLFSLSLEFALGKPADPPKARPCGRSDWTHGDAGLCGGPLLDTAIDYCTDSCGQYRRVVVSLRY